MTDREILETYDNAEDFANCIECGFCPNCSIKDYCKDMNTCGCYETALEYYKSIENESRKTMTNEEILEKYNNSTSFAEDMYNNGCNKCPIKKYCERFDDTCFDIATSYYESIDSREKKTNNKIMTDEEMLENFDTAQKFADYCGDTYYCSNCDKCPADAFCAKMSECLSCEDKALAYYNAIKTKEERLTRCNEEKSVYYSAVNALNESKEEEEMEEMKVIITNDCNDTYNVILTEKQYAFLEFLSDNGLLYDSVDWQIVKDENFERIN